MNECAAHHTFARRAGSGGPVAAADSGTAQPPTEPRLAIRLDPHEDLGIGGGDLGCGRRTVAKPGAQCVRRYQKVRVAHSAPAARSPPSGSPSGPPSGSATSRRSPVVVRTAAAQLARFDGTPGLGQPLVLGVRDDHCPVGEFDLEAGPALHHVGRRDHPRRQPVRRRSARRRPRRRAIVVHPVGVGSGVSSDSALPTPGRAATTII